MTDDELIDFLTKIDKKLDKTLNLLTKMGKVLHLLPVTEKEEKALQIQQRANLAQSAKVNHELNVMENKTDESEEIPLTLDAFLKGGDDVYADVLADDVLGGR